jgi:hypothetical protein
MALETNLNEKRKEKGKRNLTCAAGGLEACPSRHAFLPALLGRRNPKPALPAHPRAYVGRPRSRCCRVLSLPCLADERTPHASRALLPLAVTEPDTKTPQPNQPSIPGFPTRKRRIGAIKR